MQQDRPFDRNMSIVQLVIKELKSSEKKSEQLDWTDNTKVGRFLFAVFKKWVDDRILGGDVRNHDSVKPETPGKGTRRKPSKWEEWKAELLNPKPEGPFEDLYNHVIHGLDTFTKDKDAFWDDLDTGKEVANITNLYNRVKYKTLDEILNDKMWHAWSKKTNFVVVLLQYALEHDFDHRFNMLKGKVAAQRVKTLREHFINAYIDARRNDYYEKQMKKKDRPRNKEANPAAQNPAVEQDEAGQAEIPARAEPSNERRSDMNLHLTSFRDELANLHDNFKTLVDERFDSEGGESPIPENVDVEFAISLNDGRYDEFFFAQKKEQFLLCGDGRVVACAIVEAPADGKVYVLRLDSVRWLSEEEDGGDLIEVWETETMKEAVKMVLDEINRDEDLADGLFALDKPEIGDDFDSVEQKLIRLLAAENR